MYPVCFPRSNLFFEISFAVYFKTIFALPQDEDWKKAYSKLTEDIDGKLDRLELDPLKEWLEARLKALNDKLKKYQTNMDWSEDDAAGIRK